MDWEYADLEQEITQCLVRTVRCLVLVGAFQPDCHEQARDCRVGKASEDF